MFKRLRNLIRLSALEQSELPDGEIVLNTHKEEVSHAKKMAQIVDLEEVDMFPKEPAKEI